MRENKEKSFGRLTLVRSIFAGRGASPVKNTISFICVGIIAVYFLAAAFMYVTEIAGWDIELTKWDKTIGSEYEQPSAENIFGTDYLGRSVFRKTIYGAKVSLTVALFASLISIAIGVPLGAAAGYYRGFLDDIIVWLYTTITTVPYILLILAFALVLKDKTINLGWLGLGVIKLEGVAAICLALGLTGWISICRIVRAEVIKHTQLEYVRTAKAYGLSNLRILFRHILPNLRHIIIIYFMMRFAYFIHAEVVLSFLGLGAKNVPSWGSMIDLARLEVTRGCWWEMTAATAAVLVISLALNIFGDTLRDRFDPKLRIV